MRFVPHTLSAVMLAGAAAAGCGGSPTSPSSFDSAASGAGLVRQAGEPTAAPQPASSPGGYGARVLREEQLCFVPAVAADGTVYPLEDWPCEVQLTLTNNGQDLANGWITASVPNEYGRAVRLRFGDPEPIPCWIQFDTDGDGIPDVFRVTTHYTGIISASGEFRLSCHFSGT